MQDDYSIAFEIVESECERQLQLAELPDGIRQALDDRNLIFGEHPEVLAILPLIMYKAVGGTAIEEVAPAGAAMEFLLAAADILDDVQDLYVPEEAHLPERLQAHYISEMELFTALMLLAEQAVIALVEKNIAIKRSTRAISIFNTFKLRSFSGQYTDAHCKVDFDSDLESSIAITRGKCGSLARCAAEMGAALATDDEEAYRLAGEYAEQLALARQMHDDVSNLWPGTGKGDDLEQLKRTMPLTYSLTQSVNGNGNGSSSLGSLVNIENAVGPVIHRSPEQTDIRKARDEIFHNGGIHFAMLQSLIHLVKARHISRRIEKRPPGEGMLERLASA